MVETAKRAFYYFNEMNSDEDDDSEYLLADTEASDDDSIDVEIGFADYWECVKCKNKQNNPLYRYCEKCYQVSKVLDKRLSENFNLSTKSTETIQNFIKSLAI